jgi:hypothetical protein
MDNEKLGMAIDEVENLLYALKLKMPNEFHVKMLQQSLPKLVEKLKAGFVEATGENPWE